MKTKFAHIVLSSFLISALLFAQVGVNFFHRNHDVHQNKSITAPLKGDKASVQKHDEHCKVCSIDFFNHAFVPSELNFITLSFFEVHQSGLYYFAAVGTLAYTQGRAPPLS